MWVWHFWVIGRKYKKPWLCGHFYGCFWISKLSHLQCDCFFLTGYPCWHINTCFEVSKRTCLRWNAKSRSFFNGHIDTCFWSPNKHDYFILEYQKQVIFFQYDAFWGKAVLNEGERRKLLKRKKGKGSFLVWHRDLPSKWVILNMTCF